MRTLVCPTRWVVEEREIAGGSCAMVYGFD